MNTINRTDPKTAEDILTLFRAYVGDHGNDLETSDYLRLQADVMDKTGQKPHEGYMDEILGYLWTEAQVDAGNILPGLWPVRHPEHGPAVSEWKARNDDDVSAAMVHLTWKAA